MRPFTGLTGAISGASEVSVGGGARIENDPPCRLCSHRSSSPQPNSRGPQRGHAGQQVGRVGQRPGGRQQVADLAGLVDQRAGLGADRRSPAASSASSRNGREVRAGSRTAMSPSRSGRHASPTSSQTVQRSANAPAMTAGNVGRLAFAQQLGIRPVGVRLGTEDGDGWAGPGREAERVERLVVGLGLGCRLDQLGEHVVDPVQQRRHGTEVGGQRHGVAEPLAPPAGRCDVGPPEPVDRLLRIADDEQRPGGHGSRPPSRAVAVAATGDADREFDLDRVGVLELVQQQYLVLALQRAADLGVRSRSSRRASTSRSWNSSRPSAARSAAASCTRCGDPVRQRSQRGIRECGGDRRRRLGLPLSGSRRADRRGHGQFCFAAVAEVQTRPARLRCGEHLSFVVDRGRLLHPARRGQSSLPRNLSVGVRALHRARRQQRRLVDEFPGVGQLDLAEALPAAPGPRSGPSCRRAPWSSERNLSSVTPAAMASSSGSETRLVVQQPALHHRPALVERDRRCDLVHHLDQWRQSGLDRVRGEDPLREGVQRADRGGVELVQRVRGARSASTVVARESRLPARPSRTRPAAGHGARRRPSR